MKKSVLTAVKLSMISNHILKALGDDNVSNDEYSLIITEIDKYRQMEDLCMKCEKSVDEQTKESLICNTINGQ